MNASSIQNSNIVINSNNNSANKNIYLNTEEDEDV